MKNRQQPTCLQSKHNSQGFTLVEILIAMTILFATVTTGMVAWNNSLQSAERARKIVILLSRADYFQSHILHRLQNNPDPFNMGNGVFLETNFQWQAQQIEMLPPPPRYDHDYGMELEYQPRYRLYAVTLELEYQGITRVFNYQELTWSPFAEML